MSGLMPTHDPSRSNLGDVQRANTREMRDIRTRLLRDPTQPSNVVPMPATAAADPHPGTSVQFSREDHIHPGAVYVQPTAPTVYAIGTLWFDTSA